MQTPHSLEHTGKTGKGVLHYTCNPPSQETLDKYGISCLGTDFGCGDSREIVLIPYPVFTKKGISIEGDNDSLKIQSENLLRNLEKRVA
ncbi:hypothetical protein K8R47_01605 [archaeon]|nr:hypothetical protein [archaeon]